MFICPSLFEGYGLGAPQAIFYGLHCLLSDIPPCNQHFSEFSSVKMLRDVQDQFSWASACSDLVTSIRSSSHLLFSHPFSEPPNVVDSSQSLFVSNSFGFQKL